MEYPEAAQPAAYSRWISMVTEVSFPLGMALLVARQTMLSPFSMSEGAMKRVLMILSRLPSRRSVCGGRKGDEKRQFPTGEGPLPLARSRAGLCTHRATPRLYQFLSQAALSAITVPLAGICQEALGE